MNLVVVVRKRFWEDKQWMDYFLYNGNGNPEEEFRSAITEYLLTEDGERAINHTSNDFNWGDAMQEVPRSLYEQRGLYAVSSQENITLNDVIEVVVDQDEVLIPDY